MAASTSDHRREALAALFDREFAAVYRFSLARTGSPTGAEDVASDVFIDAARMFSEGKADQVTTGWLITVARRRIIDRWRVDERQRQRIEKLALLRQDTTSHMAERQEGAVMDALRALPDRQRIAIVLRYLDGLSVSEVAEALDTTYSAAESLLSRGRQTLSNTLEEFQ